MKKALITGITGQDGSYLAELLLSKGYEVHGVVRRSSNFNTQRINHLFADERIKDRTFFLHYGDLSDGGALSDLVAGLKPDELYNLGAQSHVKVSFEIPEYTLDINAGGAQRLLNAVVKHSPATRFYQASTSEMYGGVAAEMPTGGYDETCRFHPRSPYASSKVCAYWLTVNSREAYGLHASNGIQFNHESPRRGGTFVTRKITRWLGENAHYLAEGRVLNRLKLGNLDARRDWGHAQDYVEAMWLMLQQDKPGDYVVATGASHTVREFINECFRCKKIAVEWRGSGAGEQCLLGGTIPCIEVDPRYFRPAEVDTLLGNAVKARKVLGWKPSHTFESLVESMLKAEEYRFGGAGEGL